MKGLPQTMTLHHVEHEKRVPQARDDEPTIFYLPLDTIVALYEEEMVQGERELQEVSVEIQEIQRQLYEQFLRMNDRREVMAINLGINENEIKVIPSAKEKLFEEQLLGRLDKLEVVRKRMQDSLEVTRIQAIRHDEEIKRRMFNAATSVGY